MKILYACNDLDYFAAHRMYLANAMVKEKWEVLLSTGGVEISEARIDAEHITILPVDLDRHQLNLQNDFGLIGAYIKQLNSEKPDVVHAITIKPILFMGLALLIQKMRFKPIPKLVWTFPGLGKVFEPDTSLKASLRKLIVSKLLQLSNFFLKPSSTFENYSNMNELIKKKIISQQNASVVMGAGLDREQFYSASRKGNLSVIFASRLLKAKGLEEYIEAAKTLKPEFPKVSFLVAGKHEADNPDAFSMSALSSAHEADIIDYIGAIAPQEMANTLRSADIHIAPSKLQEGLPRVVLEAASCGCCVIASDHEMLQKIVAEGETGSLLNEVSVKAIVNALRPLLSNTEKTRKMGSLIAKRAKDLPIYEDNITAHFLTIYDI